MTKHFNIEYLSKRYDCFNQNELLGYINNKTDTASRFAIENHLLDCEICSDIIDGLQEINKNEGAQEYLTSVKKDVKALINSYGKDNAKFIWWWVAAVFVIALGSFLFFSQQATQLKKEEFAQRIEEKKIIPSATQEKPTTTKHLSNKTILLKEQTTSKPQRKLNSLPIESSKKLPHQLGNESIINTNDQQSPVNTCQQQNDKSIETKATYPISALSTSRTSLSEIVTGEVMPDDVEEDTKKEIVRKKNAEFENTSAPAATVQKDALNLNSENLVSEAKKLYEQKNYTDAANLYAQVYYEKNNLEASYYAALSYYNSKNYTTALDFCFVTITAKKEFFEDAQWLKYQIYIAQNNTEKAKETLQEISKQGSKFSKRAYKELQKLN